MNNQLENRISMYYKVKEFFANNLATLAVTAPALTASNTTFGTQLTALDQLVIIADETNTGYTVQKQANRVSMRDKALAIAGGLYAYAKGAGNNPLAGRVYTTKSTLDQKRDTDILYWCERLYTLALANAASLVPMGITASVLAAFNTANSTFKNTIQDPADKRGEGKAALIEAEKQTERIDATLDIIDGIMLAVNPVHPLLYNQYKANRLIDDNAGGIGSPDVIEIIEAGNLESILNIAYLGSRTFTLKNTGNVDLKWGLSDNDVTASNALTTVSAGSSSTKLSSSLAPNGDFLLVQNTNATDGSVELTIVE